ncbi:MAG TPA: terpene cyclase/mutase family protein [Clostridiales bacterium]|nr:terpene cyclase/mutase family protein [Clostridiales bacterium]
MKKVKVGVLLVVSVLILVFPVLNVSAIYYGFDEKIDSAMEYIKNNHKSEVTADIWSLLCVAAAGKMEDPEYSFMVPNISAVDFSESTPDTDIAKAIISLIIMGKDPADFEGKDLTAELTRRQKDNGAFSENSTANSHAFNIIALELADVDYNSQNAVDYLISLRKRDGGYTYDNSSNVGNVDTSGIALAALSFTEYGKSNSKPTIEYLKSVLTADGNFVGKDEYAAANSCSQALAIIGLYLIGEDLFDNTWYKAATALMSYQAQNGGFAYQQGNEPDYFSTHQVIPALYALNKAYENTSPSQPRILNNPKTGDEGIHPAIITFAVISLFIVVACVVIPIINKKNKK